MSTPIKGAPRILNVLRSSSVRGVDVFEPMTAAYAGTIFDSVRTQCARSSHGPAAMALPLKDKH
jgi:hypothetical protein